MAIAALAVLVVAVVLLPIPRPGFGFISFDVYAYYYVHTLYALRALAAGGAGLLWNPFQACGVPFLANQFTGLFYPPHWLFPFFGVDAGLYAVTVVNHLVGAIGTYALARELGLGRAAALVGGMGFGLGNVALALSSWNPAVAGPLVWFPAAMWSCERLLKRVTLGGIVAFGIFLTLAFLPGFPQIVLFLYLLIAMRAVWALLGRECAHPVRSIVALGLGLGLPLLLGAVQVFPAFELAWLSLRNVPLAPHAQKGGFTWSALYQALVQRRAMGAPYLPVTLCLAVVAFASERERRRLVLFYALAGAVFLNLSFGPGNPLFDLWVRLPLGQRFAGPNRFIWPVAFCVSVLAAFGVEVIAGAASRARWRGLPAALAGGMVLLVGALMVPGLTRWEVAMFALVAATAVAGLAPRAAALVGPALVLAVALNVTLAPFGWLFAWFPTGAKLFEHYEFATLRERLSPQDRAALANPGQDFSFMRKTPAVFQFAANFDYEAQMPLRYANYFTMMRTGRPTATLDDIYYPSFNWFPNPSRRLLDLTAARYLVVDRRTDRTSTVFPEPPLRPVSFGPEAPLVAPLQIYENDAAFPRAFFVPQAVVVRDPQELLVRMAAGTDDPRQVVLIEETPPSGFLGEGGVATGEVTFERNDPEHVVLRTQAPRRGFLFLADQFYPGWVARVNDQSVPILRGNYTFRVVEVPAGASVVEFDFQPRSVLLGAVVSLVTAIALGIALVVTRRAAVT